MSVISIQTKKVLDLDEVLSVDNSDYMMIHDGAGLKKMKVGLVFSVSNLYQAVFNPATGLDEYGNALPAPAAVNSNFYWISNGTASWTPPGGSVAFDWTPGDWCISNGTEYARVPAATVDIVARQAAADVTTQLGTFLNTAAGHNGIYRGKYLGGTVTTAQYAAIAAGTFDDMYIGDYWTIGGVNWRIAAFDYYYRCGDNADLRTHHVTIVPDSALYNAQMNASNITTGGYVGSAMYISNLEQAKTTINNAFPGHVLTHRVLLTNAVNNGKPSGGAWFDSAIELMNEIMVYGTKIFSPLSDGTTINYDYTVSKTQLPLFAMRPDLISNRITYWLRDVVSSAHFAYVNTAGLASYLAASYSLGVRPAFSIS